MAQKRSTVLGKGDHKGVEGGESAIRGARGGQGSELQRGARSCAEGGSGFCRGCWAPTGGAGELVASFPCVPVPSQASHPLPPWRCAAWMAFSSRPTRMSSWAGSPKSWSTSCCKGSTTGERPATAASGRVVFARGDPLPAATCGPWAVARAAPGAMVRCDSCLVFCISSAE